MPDISIFKNASDNLGITDKIPPEEISDSYVYLVRDVMEYIIAEKKEDTPILHLIQDYCFKKDIPIELVGDAIQDDEYFKQFILSDCEHYNIIRSKNKKLDEW